MNFGCIFIIENLPIILVVAVMDKIIIMYVSSKQRQRIVVQSYMYIRVFLSRNSDKTSLALKHCVTLIHWNSAYPFHYTTLYPYGPKLAHISLNIIFKPVTQTSQKSILCDFDIFSIRLIFKLIKPKM